MQATLNVKILEHTPNPEKLVSNAARLCYSELGIEDLFNKFTDEQNQAMVERLMNMSHESPLEHISFTFGIEGISRSLSHQLIRHRIGSSYSQKSQRYVNEEQFDYVVPIDIQNNKEALEKFEKAMKYISYTYADISDILYSDYMKYDGTDKSKANRKKAMENARAVLPNACETKIIVTMNARALLNFFKLRCCRRSQDEIMELADEMLRQVKQIAPSVFKYAGASCMFGKCPEGKMSCGRVRKVEEYE